MEVIHSKFSKSVTQRFVKDPTRGGTRYLGGGCTAKVYCYGRDKVTRVQEWRTDYNPADHLRWAEFCLKSRSKHVPKIFFLGVERDVMGKVTKVVTVLERLGYAGAPFEDSAWAMESYLMGWDDWSGISGRLHPKMKEVFPYGAAKRLRAKLKDSGVHFNDLHDENWMIRKSDGRLVITDPIC
ncbi:hypothetical protein D3C84_724640 [compost metagenome]